MFACDRLGRHDEAIEWMARKLVVLSRESNAEHEYRYLANLGTFFAHRWFANGADRDDMADLEEARDLITQAIKLNPDAHFGREKYQLMAIEWILYPPELDGGYYLPMFIDVPGFRDEAAVEITKGLSGLVVLGNAWESIDVYYALDAAVSSQGHASVSRLVEHRIDDLIEAGKTTIYPLPQEINGEKIVRVDEAMMHFRGGVEHTEIVDDFYVDARAAAKLWHENRTAYMMARLERGEHPDTYDDFWNEWDDEPALPSPPGIIATTASGVMRGDIVSVAIVAIGLLVLMWLFSVYRRNRKNASTE